MARNSKLKYEELVKEGKNTSKSCRGRKEDEELSSESEDE